MAKILDKATAVVAVVVMVVASSLVSEASKCDPSCAGNSFGDKVVDPRNCTHYYFCLGDDILADHPTDCESGKYFDASSLSCVDDNGKACEPLCLPGDSGGCILTCNSTLEYISVFGQCNQYRKCEPSGPSTPPEICPDTHPYFDGEQCGDDPDVCCDNLCEVFCSGPDTTAPDPNDCTSFYFCLADGEPDPDLKFTCPNSWNFDVTTGECSSTAPCITLCNEGKNSTAAGATTTTTSNSPSSGCVDSLTCTAVGYFPACSDCQPQFFDCTVGVGQPGILSRCPGNLVFDTNPAYPICVLPENCPYNG